MIRLQSLFTWIFYLFEEMIYYTREQKKASILIHLDFLSIYGVIEHKELGKGGFNPYSPGFSIYFLGKDWFSDSLQQLQSLFTWIFYLFNRLVKI